MFSYFNLNFRGKNHGYHGVPQAESVHTDTPDGRRKDPPVIKDPFLYRVSPLAGWLTSTIVRVKKADYFGIEELPTFAKNAEHLKAYAQPLKSGKLSAFFLQYEVGGLLLLGALLELVSDVCILASPMILRDFLNSPPSLRLVWTLFLVNILSSITGRAKDQIGRVQAEQIACMLQTAVYEKSLELSTKARLKYPAAKIINISNTDVAALKDYFAKVHDLWSCLFQIFAIAFLVHSILGSSSLYGFATIIVMLASQSVANGYNANIIRNCIANNDQRIKFLREFLYQVKGVKALGLERHFYLRISKARSILLNWVKKWLWLNFAIFSCLNQIMPGVIAAVSFVVFWYQGHELNAANVFPSLALFDLIRAPAFRVSLSIARQFTVVPSFRRVVGLLSAEEDNDFSVLLQPTSNPEGFAVTFKNAIFQHPKAERCVVADSGTEFVLGPLNLEIPKNRLTMCVGPVAAGKTSLLNAIIGIMKPERPGTLQIGVQRMALCTQDPWIKSGSVRENIVFFSDYNEARYQETVEMCCLAEDLKNWGGDGLLIGEKGINLSGGQRARIALARAVYSQAELILLDDPLSAVDVHIGKRLFFDCIRQLPRTVLLVTHQVSFLPYVDNVIALREGKVVEHGAPDSLLARNDSFVSSFLTSADQKRPHSKSVIDEGGVVKIKSGESKVQTEPHNQIVLIEVEERATGSVGRAVYSFYIGCAGGRTFLGPALGIFTLSVVVRIFTSYYFILWLDNSLGLSPSGYISGYLSLTILQSIFFVFLALITIRGSLKASKVIHESVLTNLMTATMQYFESQPIGRILNRLSSDIDTIDTGLLDTSDGLLVAVGSILTSIFVILITAPYLIVIAIPLAALSHYFQQLYRVSARELRRLLAILKSPAVSIVSETLGAIPTIKAYKAEKHFQHQYASLLDKTYAADIVRQSLSTWITFRAEMISAFLVLAVALLSYFSLLSTLAAGLALSTAITFTKNIYLLLWCIIQLEVEMNSVERLEHYVKRIPSEVSEDLLRADASWPRHGAIKFEKISVRYRTRTDFALDCIDLKIEAGQRVGIVGRTGSGKTTLVSTLSRLVNISTGNISIDGIDISKVPLEQLRHSVSVLPQEPLLFEGSLRQNLDPEEVFQDSELLHVLQLCGLTSNLRQDQDNTEALIPTRLDAHISSGGENVSAGERQLIVIARVLLKKPRILIIDEATSSIPPLTSNQIQQTLQTQFPGTTILCIAHRISTLNWMDRILVMENGRIVEDGNPVELLGNPESRWRELMRAAENLDIEG